MTTSLFHPTEEHAELRRTLRAFVENEIDPQAAEHDRNESFNRALFEKIGDLGLLGVTVPEEYGGAGMDAVAACIAHEEISASDPGFALAYLAHSMLCVNNLYQNASDDQRARHLPDLCTGKKIGGMCMSEPAVGTDVLGMATSAVRKGDAYVLNGRKMWITNGAMGPGETGDTFLVYARTGGKGAKALSMFIVEKGFSGFSLGQKLDDKLGMRASMTAELVFEDCEVPIANRVGDEGTAVRHMMRNLEIERLTLAAMGLGIARRSFEIMNRYASERVAFGKPIREFGQIQRYLANSYAQYMAGRSYVYDVAGRLDLASPGNRVETDGVKLFCTTMAKDVADNAIQVLGGYGYMGEYQVERLWRDAKLLEIGGGTLESHQKNMTRDLANLTEIV